jgi:nicotinamidase-related amidase
MQPITIDLARTALVVIDVQVDYFPKGRFPNGGARGALKKTLLLRDWARNLGLPVFWIRHTSPANARFFRQGTPGRELHPTLSPLSDEPIVDKANPNSFMGTDLEDQLRARGITTVVWCGMMSWMCVDTTVRSAKDRGFTNLLAHDACAAGWLKGPYGIVTPRSSHKAFVSALGFHHATVLATKEVVSMKPAL